MTNIFNNEVCKRNLDLLIIKDKNSFEEGIEELLTNYKEDLDNKIKKSAIIYIKDKESYKLPKKPYLGYLETFKRLNRFSSYELDNKFYKNVINNLEDYVNLGIKRWLISSDNESYANSIGIFLINGTNPDIELYYDCYKSSKDELIKLGEYLSSKNYNENILSRLYQLKSRGYGKLKPLYYEKDQI